MLKVSFKDTASTYTYTGITRFSCVKIFHNVKLISFFSFSDDNLIHKDPTVQERAINAVPAFVDEYFSGKNSGKFDGLLQQYTAQLDTSELHLRGFALALGSLPKNLLQGIGKVYFK